VGPDTRGTTLGDSALAHCALGPGEPHLQDSALAHCVRSLTAGTLWAPAVSRPGEAAPPGWAHTYHNQIAGIQRAWRERGREFGLRPHRAWWLRGGSFFSAGIFLAYFP